MSSTANAKCVTRDGKLAFIAEGDVLLFCSSDTCGPNGKAEFGCEDCCRWPYGSTSIPTGSPAVQSSASLHPVVIACIALVAIGFALALICFIYFLVEKFVWKKESRLDEEAGLENGHEVHSDGEGSSGNNISRTVTGTDHREVALSDQSVVLQPSDGHDMHLSQQPSVGEGSSGNNISQTIAGAFPTQVTMSGQNVVMQPSYDGELILAQHPTDGDEHGRHQASQVVASTSVEQPVIVITSVSVAWHNSEPVSTGVGPHGSVPVNNLGPCIHLSNEAL